MFQDPFVPNLSIEDFNVKFTKNIHANIMENLWDKSGQIRHRDVKPSDENLIYLKSDEIVVELETLFENTVSFVKIIDKTINQDEKLERMVKLGAQFLSRFLYIHPFSNGNGRVGTILLSYLLSNFSVLPVSLYIKNTERDVFLNCLKERHNNQELNFNTNAWALLILDCIYKIMNDVNYALDLGND